MLLGTGRMTGKTTKIIQKAAAENLYIVCFSKDVARLIDRKAKELNVQIPYPISVGELPLHQNANIEGVLVDDAEIVLSKLIGKPVKAMTTSFDESEMKEAVAIDDDNVNQPLHYQRGGIETLDFIKAKVDYEPAAIFNVIKYVSRYKDKNGLEDLKKAQFYLNDVIEWMEQHPNEIEEVYDGFGNLLDVVTHEES